VEEEKGMKRWLPTGIAVLVLAGLWLIYSGPGGPDAEKDQEEPLFPGVRAQDVSQLVLREKGKVSLELKKTGNGWEFVRPRPLPVDREAVDAWVSSFVDLKNAEPVEKERPDDVAPFGLKDPELSLTAVLKDGKTLRLDVGSQIPVEGGNYVTTGDQAPVLKLDAMQAEGLRKRALDLMEKRPVPLDSEKVTAVRAEWKGEKLSAEKKGDQWKLTAGKNRFDPERIAGWLDHLTYLQTEELAVEGKSLAKKEPVLSLTVKWKGKERTYVGIRHKDRIWIMERGGKWAWSFEEKRIGEWMRQVEKEPKEE
jgi:hypothetical protein